MGDGQEGEDVRGDEVLLEADPDHQGAALAGGHQVLRVLGVDDPEGVGAGHARGGPAHRLHEGVAGFELVVDGMDDHLGVGLRGEAVAGGRLPLAQQLVVLDDAVVHDDAPVPAHMGVGIACRGLPVGGPTGVGDPQAPRQRVDGDLLPEPRHLAQGADAIEDARRLQDRDPGGVVAPILQATEPFEQDGRDRPLGDGADDTAHGLFPCSRVIGLDQVLGCLRGRCQPGMVT